MADASEAPDVESTFEVLEVPEHRDHEAAFRGVHERGDRRIVREFTVGEEAVTVDAYYFLDGSRLEGVREGTVEVEEAERRDGDVESFCRRWHGRDVESQLGDGFEEAIERNREKPWVRRYLARGDG